MMFSVESRVFGVRTEIIEVFSTCAYKKLWIESQGEHHNEVRNRLWLRLTYEETIVVYHNVLHQSHELIFISQVTSSVVLSLSA